MGSKYRISKQEILPDAQLLARPPSTLTPALPGSGGLNVSSPAELLSGFTGSGRLSAYGEGYRGRRSFREFGCGAQAWA